MQVEVRLFATLRRYAPGGSALVELPDGATVDELIRRLGIPPALAQLVMVDGVHQPDPKHRLTGGAVVSIFPPVAGGSGSRSGPLQLADGLERAALALSA